jgi:hypothetical protein
MVHYHQREYTKALDSLTQIVNLDDLSTKLPLPERSRIEALNIMTLASLKSSKKDMGQSIRLWQAGMQGSQRLQSEQRYNEAVVAYDIMEGIWPGEERVNNLRELSMHW